ncbi:MAG: NAD(P)H-dependent oxidoreductase [Saprospiraceae bacterium]|nr:NAD(P)H-dependent oxidoreductase [Candidatus Defluviibacterium haderslevense]
MNIVIILGSSRTNGETGQIVNQLQNITKWDVIDLNDYNINNYDYEHKNKNDDYLTLMRRIINKYDVFIFATPVYWYAMSGKMKTFFDRFTDLLDDEKELGRKLRTKSMAAISSSQGSNLGDGFWLPFSNSAEYLGMKYLGNTHFVTGQNEKENMTYFIDLINKSTKAT